MQVIKYPVEESGGGAGTLCVRDSNGILPIHRACSRRYAPFELIRYLAEQAPASLYISNNNNGALPIHVACQFGVSLQIVKCFIEDNDGADALRAHDNNGYLPLHTLCGSNNPSLKTVEYLVKTNAAALSTRWISGDLPVTLAYESASLIVVYTLIRDDACTRSCRIVVNSTEGNTSYMNQTII